MSDDRVNTGKIGRLPFDVREALNLRLLDGASGPDILPWLNALPAFRAQGVAPVNPQNLSAWRQVGYQRWLEERRKAGRLADMAEKAAHIAAATGDPAGVSSRLLLGRILDVIEAADNETDLGPLVKAVSELRRGEIDRSRLDLAHDQFDLERTRFQRQTCVLFLTWYADRRASEIAADTSTDTAAKTELLGSLMFGDLWQGQDEEAT